MKCFSCNGEIKQVRTKFIVDLGPCVVIVKNVPAMVCQTCGETSYSDEVAQKLETIVEAVRNSVMTEVAIVEYSAHVA